MKVSHCDFCRSEILKPNSKLTDEEFIALFMFDRTREVSKLKPIDFDLCEVCQTKVKLIVDKAKMDILALRIVESPSFSKSPTQGQLI